MNINIADTVAAGECTNDHGPGADDWFLVLVMRDGNWYWVSKYAKNIEVVSEYLGKKFQDDMVFGDLVGSTSWKSVVCYPLHLRGRRCLS